MQYDRTQFGKRLREARENTGLTQSMLATRLGVRQGTISAYECGQRLPDVELLAMFAQTLNVNADWLLFGEAQQKSNNVENITAEQWLKYFYDLLAKPQDTTHCVEHPESGMTVKLRRPSITLDLAVRCDEPMHELNEDPATSEWSWDECPVARVEFYGCEMAAFFQQIALINQVQKQLPREMVQALERNAIEKGAPMFRLNVPDSEKVLTCDGAAERGKAHGQTEKEN